MPAGKLNILKTSKQVPACDAMLRWRLIRHVEVTNWITCFDPSIVYARVSVLPCFVDGWAMTFVKGWRSTLKETAATRSWPLGCSWASFRSWCHRLAIVLGWSNQDTYFSLLKGHFTLIIRQEQFFIRKGRKWVFTLNSNWTVFQVYFLETRSLRNSNMVPWESKS